MKSVEYEIEGGPSRNEVEEALSHDVREFHPQFIVADYYTSPPGRPNRPFIPLEMSEINIVSMRLEDNNRLFLCGNCRCDICIGDSGRQIHRFNAYYNTLRQKGYISFFE